VLDFLRFAGTVDVEARVHLFADVPCKLKFVNVVVVPAVNLIDVAPTVLYVFVMSLKVLEPVMVNAALPAKFNVQLNVASRVEKVPPLITEIFPVPVPAVVVKFVPTFVKGFVVDERVRPPPLNVIFLGEEVALTKKLVLVVLVVDKVFPFKFIVPALKTIGDVARVTLQESKRTTVPPGELILKAVANDFPAVKICCVLRPQKTGVPVLVIVEPVPNLKSPTKLGF
jgi:hypothetical protein